MSRWYQAGFFMLLIVIAAPGSVSAREQLNVPAPAGATGVPTAFVHHAAKAPADEYFGRFRMSILGVRNTIADIDTHVDVTADAGAQRLCRKLVLAEDALRDWQAKYPDDAWIPRLGYAMLKDYETLDALILVEDFHDASVHAIDLSNWLDATFPNSQFAPK